MPSHLNTMFGKQLNVLGHEGLGFTEIRCPSDKFQFFSEDAQELQKVVDKYTEARKDVYVSINPRYGDSGTNADVSYLTCIVFDVDPIRPVGQGSTEEQLEEAMNVASALEESLPGTSRTITVLSGSGFHVYLPIKPIEITNHKAIAESLKLWAKQFKDKFTTDKVKVDSIFDLARVIRVWGSHNNKSNRACEIHANGGDPSEPRYELTLSQVKQKKELVLVTNNTRFNKLALVHPVISKMMRGEGNYGPSRSEADFCFISSLLKAGFTTAETFELAKLNPLGRRNEVKLSDVERIAKDKLQISRDNGTSNYFDSLGKRTKGLSTGFPRLDSTIAGLKNERLYLIAARPSQGKTSLSVDIAHNVASSGSTVLYFPTELGASSIYDKIMSKVCEIDLRKFQFGSFNEEEQNRLSLRKDYLSTLPLKIHEDFSLDVSRIEKAITEKMPEVVFIDHLQALSYRNGGDPHEMGDAIRRIKELACKYSIPIVLCAQLNRGFDGAEVSLSNLKGSGATEEFADVVLFIVTLDRDVNPRPVDIITMKNRYGSTDTVRMDFITQFCKFKEVE